MWRVAELLPYDEWLFWVDFFRHSPFGPRRDTFHFGKLGSALVGAWGGSADPADLFPTLRRPAGDAAGFAAWVVARCPALSAVR